MISAFDIEWRRLNQRMLTNRSLSMDDRIRVGRIIAATTPLDVDLSLPEIVERVMQMTDDEVEAFIHLYELGQLAGA